MERLLSREVELKHSHVDIIELPFSSPVHLPFGTIATRPSAWLNVEGLVDNQAAHGAAEGTALPIRIPMYDDHSDNLAQNITSITSALNSKKLSLAAAIETIRDIDLNGNFATARMTVEAALIDMIARSDNASVMNAITDGTVDRPLSVPYGKSITENESQAILDACHSAVQKGAQRLKFKLSPQNYDELYPALKQLISEYSDADFMVDANGMFDPDNESHIAMLSNIDALGLLTIEEPVSRTGRLKGLAAHSDLHKKMSFHTPITIDDSIKTSEDARYALDNNIADIINLKPGRVGSFIECMKIAQEAKSKNKEVMVGGMFEATPGRMMTLTLAAYCINLGFKIPGDLSLPQERLDQDLVSEKLTLNERQEVVFNPSKGWGYEL